MNCDVGEVTEILENELCSNPSFASPTPQDFHLRHLASSPWGIGEMKLLEIGKNGRKTRERQNEESVYG